jgi:hypothetical protein
MKPSASELPNWFLAPLAAPAALLIGSTLWYAFAFGAHGLGTRLLWQSVIVFYACLASYALSPLVFALIRRRRLFTTSRATSVLAVVATAVAFTVAFLSWQSVGSWVSIALAVLLGVLLNALVFSQLAPAP